MREVSEYDKRQLGLMMQQLNSFEKGEIDLVALQSSLEFLLQAMESVDDSWEDAFLSEIATLASINSGLPDDIPINVKGIIVESIESLKKLVEGFKNF